ncbi:MAG: hypothetical protein CMJ34_00160 [Phycisphaerae bacterium]|nr:hypothetical protein [Phycisphaerae bacterium]
MNARASLAIIPLLICMLTGSLHAQAPENYWINPDGGDWNEASNWSFGQVPDDVTPAYFILPDSYTVFSGRTFVNGIYVDAGEIDFVSVASKRSFYDFEILQLLEITGSISNDQAARFRLRGEGDAFIDTLELGLGRLGSGFTIGSGREIDVLTLNASRYASLRFELGDRAADIDESLMILGQVVAPCGFELVPSDGSFLPPGDSLQLIDADLGGASTTLPEFGRAETPPGRDLLVEIQQRTDGSLTGMTVKAERADSTGTTDASFDFLLGGDPIDLVPIDYDEDGDDDLVVVQGSGKHEVFELTTEGYQWLEYFETEPSVRAATTGDFDDDGRTDIAVASEIDFDGDGLNESLLQIFLAADDFAPGPFIDSPDSPVSLAAIRVPSANLLPSSGGVAMTTRRASTGRGTAKSFGTSGTQVVKIGETEVGDEPGQTDPIEEENKKDPDTPVGVGSTASGLVATPVFQVLRPSTDGFDIERTIAVSGRVLDFDSGDIDGDGEVETLVLTSANRIDLLRPLRSSEVFGSIGFKAEAVSIALADIEGDSRLEVVVGFERRDGTGFFRIYRADRILVPDAVTGSEARPFLARQTQTTIDPFGDPRVSASAFSNGFIPIAGTDTAGIPVLRTFAYQRISVTDCSTFDLNGDGVVDANDLGSLIASWGPCGKSCPADFDEDGIVGAADMGLMFSNWGPC